MNNKIIREIYLDNLPKHKEGKNKGKVNWKDSIGHTVDFIYDNIEGVVKIMDYDGKFLYLKYLNKDIFKIDRCGLKKCALGNLLGKITNEFKIEIGTNFRDNNRDLVIIDKEYRQKRNNNGKLNNWRWYKYKCNKCGCEDWKVENGLLKGDGCSICCRSGKKKVVLGINTIWDTDRWMCNLGVSEEDAKKYTRGSMKKIKVKCPNCNRTKKITINKISCYHSIFCKCSDTISYPNKFMFNLLEQLNIKFKTEYSPKWINPKRYDFNFELSNKKYIVEMDGEFHTRDNTMNGQTAEDSKKIDKFKDLKAKENGIEIIRIDCKESKLEYIKENILNSKLNKVFNFECVNWRECDEFGSSSLVRKVCELKRDNPDMSTIEISENIKLSRTTVTRYLKRGLKIWDWFIYNPKEEMIKSNTENGKKGGRKTEIFKDNTSLGVFKSCAELSRKSKMLFGVELKYGSISRVCQGNQKQYKNYTFKYID
ncbi:winged helix-turn-helix domain-containing protein [Clostridium sporogenes]|uniref:winged helix-turn-helix domain-containing protein n=1 Tax=Clostridium sporogenes TaxID=1509 RepID=UPI0013D7013C|nr:winged helix-turn-helix domain-containing protein [Clostridium sporogenes]NFH40720.1 winged helix-turn-helix domain-containing protein [Clostridium sporogenes]